MTDRELMQQALDALESCDETWVYDGEDEQIVDQYDHKLVAKARETLRARLSAPEPEPVALKQIAAKHGINMPENYIPTIDDAIAAADGVLMNEQAALLRECRAALDSLIQQKPSLAGLHCGSTTLGNLKASLYGYRPQGVFGNTAPPQREWQGLTDEEIKLFWSQSLADTEGETYLPLPEFARAIEAKLKEKNT